MPDALISLNGENYGFEWSVNVYMSQRGGFFAVVKVGSTVRTTDYYIDRYHTKDVGCLLMADMLDEKLEASHA